MNLIFSIFYTILILLFSPVRKVFGLLWFWVIKDHRAYSRSIVYNYVLNNKLHLKRLKERTFKDRGDYWEIITSHEGVIFSGYLTKLDVSWIEFQFAYWFIWGWVDDDSNYDTCDLGFIEGVLNGDHHKPRILKKYRIELEEAVTQMKTGVFGNTFDLGDLRAENPMLLPVASMLWLWRNTAYNFKYMQYESDKQYFHFTLFNYKFGWFPEFINDNTPNYTLEFFGKN